MTLIKICGITNLQDARQAAALGVDALGFIFAPSIRRLDCDKARKIIRDLPGFLLKVGVFVNSEIEEVNHIGAECGLDFLQLHGQESPDYCRRLSLPIIKALPVKDPGIAAEIDQYPSATILLDSGSGTQFGGTGKTFPWEWALDARKKRNFFLSGGLNPENVRPAVHFFRPAGVDVCSGVESVAGKKDVGKMAKFIKEVKTADETTG